MRKLNISLFFKFLSPFSIVFSLSFILIASIFNFHYDAGIDLRFVNQTYSSITQNIIKLSSSTSNYAQNIKSKFYVFAEDLKAEDKNRKSEENVYIDLDSKKNILSSDIYNFTIDSNFVYMSQHDPRWKDKGFKSGDSIDKYGCGPTVVSMIANTLTNINTNPYEVAKLMYQKGLYSPLAGSNHSIMTDGLSQYSIKSVGFSKYSKEAIICELKKENFFAVLTKKGIFSNSTGHFIVLVGIDKDENIIIADPNSVFNSKKTWKLETILKEAKYSAGSGGPFWLIEGLSGM